MAGIVARRLLVQAIPCGRLSEIVSWPRCEEPLRRQER